MSKLVGIFPNFTKCNTDKFTIQIVNWFKKQNINVALPIDAAETLKLKEKGLSIEEIAKKSEFVIVFGGDGTLLKVARQIGCYGAPILGINFGHLGFLTELEVPEFLDGLDKVLKGEYTVEERMMIEGEVIRNNESEVSFIALNDIVVTKGSFARLINLETYLNDEYIETYRADGVIIATPTGSTAYSLSAGGPIVSPELNLLLITPICPHTLHSRSIVVSDNQTVKININASHKEIMLTTDGQKGYRLKPNDKIKIKKSKYRTKLIRIKNKTFYEILRDKLAETSRNK